MSNHIDKYKARLNPFGTNIGQAFTSNTTNFMENAFTESPTYRRMGVSGTEYPDLLEIDGRAIEVERMGSLREVLFRPLSDGLNIGTYLTFDNETWLIFDRFGKSKALVAQCNRKLRWRDSKDILHEVECIASASDLGSKSKQSKNEIEWNKFDVRLPLGQLFVFVELTEQTSKIGLNDRFIFGRKVFEVTGLDDTTTVNRNGHGLLQLTIKVTTIREEDDFENGIAQNFYKEAVTPIVEESPVDEPIEDEGGMIW